MGRDPLDEAEAILRQPPKSSWELEQEQRDLEERIQSAKLREHSALIRNSTMVLELGCFGCPHCRCDYDLCCMYGVNNGNFWYTGFSRETNHRGLLQEVAAHREYVVAKGTACTLVIGCRFKEGSGCSCCCGATWDRMNS